MADRLVHRRRILVVEDEYMLADELRGELEASGAVVLGPVATLEEALARIGAERHLDGAVLDVNLRGEWAYPAADLLVRRQVPFVFTTGYDGAAIPARFARVPRHAKPVSLAAVVHALGMRMRA